MSRYFSPHGLSPHLSKAKTKILCVGAHPDDIEFMCIEPIARSKKSGIFSGLVITSGAGSLRASEHDSLSTQEYSELRWEEQKKAATLGAYAFIDGFNFESSALKKSSGMDQLTRDLQHFFSTLSLEELYIHSPFDRHGSHVRVSFSALNALRNLPKNKRPQKVFACEVWGDLDWIPKKQKVLKPLNQEALELQKILASVFISQAGVGTAKNYVQALIGRKTAHAVFQEGMEKDKAVAQEIYLDLTGWMNSELSWAELAQTLLHDFENDLKANWPHF